MDALKKQFDSKMFHFGLAALYKFITRIKENPQYCMHISAIPHFDSLPPAIIEFVQYGKNQELPPSAFSGFSPLDLMSESSYSPRGAKNNSVL